MKHANPERGAGEAVSADPAEFQDRRTPDPMRFLLLSSLAVAALAGRTSAQITSGLYTDNAGYSCTVEVSDTNGTGTPGLEVTVVDTGGSAQANGTQAASSSDERPKASSFGETTTPRGTERVRGRNGKVEKKNAAGNWVPMRKAIVRKGSNRQRLRE